MKAAAKITNKETISTSTKGASAVNLPRSYIGETNNIGQQFNEHNSGYGSVATLALQTPNSKLVPLRAQRMPVKMHQDTPTGRRNATSPTHDEESHTNNKLKMSNSRILSPKGYVT